jgi:hypothetical protein
MTDQPISEDTKETYELFEKLMELVTTPGTKTLTVLGAAATFWGTIKADAAQISPDQVEAIEKLADQIYTARLIDHATERATE